MTHLKSYTIDPYPKAQIKGYHILFRNIFVWIGLSHFHFIMERLLKIKQGQGRNRMLESIQ